MSLRLLTDSFSYFKVDRSKTVTFVKNNCSFAGRSSTDAKTRSTTTMPKKSEFKSNQSPKSVPSACGTLKSSSNEVKKIQEDNEKARQARIERAIKQRIESSRSSKHGKKQAAASGKKMSGAAQPNKKPDQVKGRASAKNFKTAK